VSSTRERILDRARELVERSDGESLNMSATAAAAGISRQALYLHFADRASLLLALVEHTDEREDLAAGLAKIQAAPTATAKLRTFLEMQAQRNPRIAPLARALDAARHADPASEQAWRDRNQGRMTGARMLARALHADGLIHDSWQLEEAALLLWQLTSFHTWDDLVNDAGLAPDRYVELMLTTALAGLAAPQTERGAIHVPQPKQG
jgi:AcrR family transcriptional regulator